MQETIEHIKLVGANIDKLIGCMLGRIATHDYTKLENPEKDLFEEVSDKLSGLTYGSPEYEENLQKLKPALDHHYKNNRHHIEHHVGGITDMNLVDLCEMICDWKAATKRHADGDIIKSLEINQKRFGYSDELKQIFHNTLLVLDE